MALTRDDIAAFARRIRPYFPEHLRDTAEELAEQVARHAGARAKDLRPDTPLSDYVQWLGEDGDSLDQAELVMAIEEEFEIDSPGGIADRLKRITFGDLVTATDLRRQPYKRRMSGR